MKHIRVFALIISLFLPFFSQGQEMVLSFQPDASKSLMQRKGLSGDTLELPFFDDFSDTEMSPNSERWADSEVYINSKFTSAMPSVGIATFDAVDETGNFHSGADYDKTFDADELSSQPINLDYPGNTSIYLSFYYRPQGFGDAPEPQDSLILEFLAPETQIWSSVWSVPGTFDADFTQVMIPISQAEYLKNGFRFRFRNIASLGSETYADLAGNCDFWHVDYVYLDKNRNAAKTSSRDVCFARPLVSLLVDYEVVPWLHYKANPVEKITNFDIALQNHEGITRSIDSLNFYNLHRETGDETVVEAGARNINPFGFLEPAGLSNLLDFPINDDLEAHFDISAQLITDAYDAPENNTISYTQNFDNYYAYDDGSAEASYGLYGTGTKYGSAACFYESLKPDSLIGVQVYFTRTLNNASQNYFWLNLWKAGSNALPYDTVFAQIEGALPEYSDTRNGFHYYEFENPVYVADSFFVGWTQTTDEMLNVGFDWNRKANQHLFFNINGSWEQSEFEGALMMRPVFMGADILPQTKSYTQTELSVSPNPAVDFIRIGDQSFEVGTRITIINIQGRVVAEKIAEGDNQLNVSDLPKGFYILQITSGQNNYRSKFIKQ